MAQNLAIIAGTIAIGTISGAIAGSLCAGLAGGILGGGVGGIVSGILFGAAGNLSGSMTYVILSSLLIRRTGPTPSILGLAARVLSIALSILAAIAAGWGILWLLALTISPFTAVTLFTSMAAISLTIALVVIPVAICCHELISS